MNDRVTGKTVFQTMSSSTPPPQPYYNTPYVHYSTSSATYQSTLPRGGYHATYHQNRLPTDYHYATLSQNNSRYYDYDENHHLHHHHHHAVTTTTTSMTPQLTFRSKVHPGSHYGNEIYDTVVYSTLGRGSRVLDIPGPVIQQQLISSPDICDLIVPPPPPPPQGVVVTTTNSLQTGTLVSIASSANNTTCTSSHTNNEHHHHVQFGTPPPPMEFCECGDERTEPGGGSHPHHRGSAAPQNVMDQKVSCLQDFRSRIIMIGSAYEKQRRSAAAAASAAAATGTTSATGTTTAPPGTSSPGAPIPPPPSCTEKS